jgi:hypothetical protein
MDFFEQIEEIKKLSSQAHDADLFSLIEAELREGLGAYWKAASRILEDSGTLLLHPSEAYFALKNNFFSMLFLYSYYRAGISGDHRIMYVSINQCLRGMVTGCDNILDNEYKKTLETDLPETGTRFRSVLDIMVSDRVMFDILLNAMERGTLSRDSALSVSAASLHALLQSGVQEASEENGIIGILPPEEVLHQVHHYKTGLLFQAPWHIPRLLEGIPKTDMDSMMEALYVTGMGCQIMDDMVDLSNDIRKHRHNYVLSLLYHNTGEEARRQVNDILASGNTLNESENILAAFPAIKAVASEKALLFLENGLKTLFEPRHHFLVKPAISFLSKRIGAGLIRLE